MKAYELMALAAKEPKKYEGKKYKVTEGSSLIAGGVNKSFEEFKISHGRFISSESPYFDLCFFCETEVEEIPQSVPFLEAVKAYSEGKTVECEYSNDSKSTYKNGNLEREIMDTTMCTLSAEEILEGKWYIKEA